MALMEQDSSPRSPTSNSDSHPDPLIFVHIAKTGGSSLTALILRHEGWRSVQSLDGGVQERDHESFKGCTPRRLEEISVVCGHGSYGYETFFEDRNPRHFSIFREPISRVVSLYNHIMRRTNHRLHAQVAGSNMSLEEFVENDVAHEIDNGMLRDIHPNHKKGKVDHHLNVIDESVFDHAREEILNEWFGFGILERMQDSIELLAHRMNWPNYYVPALNRNRSGSPGKISERAREAICQRNLYDIRLYELLVEEFDRRYEAYQADEGANRPRLVEPGAISRLFTDRLRGHLAGKRSKRA